MSSLFYDKEASYARATALKNPTIRFFHAIALTEEQQARNKKKSKSRVRVEHVFGHMEPAMGGIWVA
jgi:hypothetical protein